MVDRYRIDGRLNVGDSLLTDEEWACISAESRSAINEYVAGHEAQSQKVMSAWHIIELVSDRHRSDVDTINRLTYELECERSMRLKCEHERKT